MPSTDSQPRDLVGRFWPLAVVSLGGALVLVGLYLRIRQLCGGSLVYGLDDAYIHLAIAANLVEHGSWGVNAGEFSSTSSSLAWPLVLAALRAVTGIADHGPMVISAVLVAVILVRADAMIARRTELPPWARAVALAALFVVTPMPELVFDGMEHLLHVWFTLELLDRASRGLATLDEGSGDPGLGRRDGIALVVLAFLITTVRYEAVFLVGAIASVLATRRRWALAGAMIGAAALPIVVYGVIATSQGWPFVPTGLLLKTAVLEETAVETIRRMFNEFAAKIPGGLPLVAAVTAGLLANALGAPGRDRAERVDLHAMLLFALAVIPHLVLANLGNLFRYEAYLYAGGVLVMAGPVGRLAATLWSRAKAASRPWVRVTLLLVAVGLPGFTLAQRGAAALLATPLTSLDIYGQQIQMARFVQRYYPQGPVAINDIGAISYYTDAHVLDIVGLASREVATIHLANEDFAIRIGEEARSEGVRVALVYEPWLGDPPDGWLEVATWTVEEKIVLGWPTVTFYAVDPAEYEGLLAALYEFSRELPANVEFELADSP